MAGPRFYPVPGLDEMVALMVAPEVREVAKDVQRVAKVLAPEAKNWVHQGDSRVRTTHRAAPLDAAWNFNVPDNLRFRIDTMTRDNSRGWVWDWDAHDPESNHVHEHNTWMLHPEDWTSGAVANILDCRCRAEHDKNAIRKTVRVGPTRVTGARIRIVVSATGNRIIASEFGETYDSPAPPAVGLHWMGRAAATVAAG